MNTLGHMSDDRAASPWNTSDFFSPAACAVAAFVLATTALFGQNALTVGVANVLDGFWADQGPSGYAAYVGVATVAQFGAVVYLARRASDAPEPWQRLLARAAVLVAGIAAVGGVLSIFGALI
ncbi:MAG: hypothetical protein JWN91_3123 [Nocardioides sp.]|jgi:hypothetical protein|nr:hypothetical protein [Nocardioides sp.]